MAKKQTGLTVSLEPTPKAAEALSLLTQAQGITITDKVSHEACRTFLKGAKALKREIVEHYDAIKKPLNAAKSTVLDMERRDLGPVEQAISVAERLDTQYVRQQQELERAEANDRRRQAEADEQKRRDKEAAEAEAAALKLEHSSNVLSAREQGFVDYAACGQPSLDMLLKTVKRLGYKDAETQLKRLMESPKIQQAIANAQKAKAIRLEAEARKAAPIVVDVAPVQSQIGSVSGTSLRRYYSCGEVDLKALILAVAEDIQHGDGSKILALQPDLVYLNGQARDLKAMFSRVHPYATLVTRDGVAG